jgi:hypothetical protein
MAYFVFVFRIRKPLPGLVTLLTITPIHPCTYTLFYKVRVDNLTAVFLELTTLALENFYLDLILTGDRHKLFILSLQ